MLNTPFNADEGFYATVARMLLHGDLPYRDAFDNKPPLVFAWYAASFLLFGENVWAPRLLVSILLSLTTALVYVEGRLVYSRGGGLIAALAFALSLGIARFETDAQTEHFMLLPLVASLVAFTLGRRRGDLRWYVAAGVFAGLAMITRQMAVFPFAAMLLFAVQRPERGPPNGAGRWIAPVAAMIGGAAIVGLAVVATFAILGSFGDLWDAVVVYGWQYSNDTPVYVKVLNLFTNFLPVATLAGPWVLMAGLGVTYYLRDERRQDLLLLVEWLIAAVVAVVAGGRYYDHYNVQLLPPLALLAPAGVMFVNARWSRPRVRRLFVGVFVFGVGASLVLAGEVYVRSSANDRHLAVYPGFERTEWETESQHLADYIRAHTSEGDLIYNLGYQSELYFYADRRPASRYMFDRLFDVDSGLEAKAMAELTAHAPAMIIDSAHYETQRTSYPSPLIRAFMRENYDYAGKIDYADVYRLKR
jgi:4-amino-4-deoxy-L-arabinose transferase-like glycosyltransferase